MTDKQKQAIKELNRLQYIEEISDDIYFLLLGFVVEGVQYVPAPTFPQPYPITYTSITTYKPDADVIYERLPERFGYTTLTKTVKDMTGEGITFIKLDELLNFWTEKGMIEYQCDGSYIKKK